MKTRTLLIAASMTLGLCTAWQTYKYADVPAHQSSQQVVAPAPTTDRSIATPTAPVPQQASSAIVPAMETHKTEPLPVATAPLQGLDRLPAQRFSMNAQRDTVLHTSGGCVIHVPAGAFVDDSGKTVKGKITMEVKEALKPVDLLMSGLATVYQGQALESGGSFCISASAHGNAVELAADRPIDMAVPSRMKKAGMKLFPGTVENDKVVWQEALPLEAPAEKAMVAQEAMLIAVDMDMRTNITYSVDGFIDAFDAPAEVTVKVVEVVWSNGGLWLQRDSTFNVGKHTVHFYTNREVTVESRVPIWNAGTLQGVADIGTNTFQEDPKTNYIFQVKRLGWANIDRLLNDKRTQRVDMVTRIDDTKDLKGVTLSLVMKSHNLYIPGYERADGNYGFSHGDHEPMRLPVGAKAIVLATAQRDGKNCYAMQEIVIDRKTHIDLHMTPISSEELRTTLMAAL